jgi:hypothetical protein
MQHQDGSVRKEVSWPGRTNRFRHDPALSLRWSRPLSEFTVVLVSNWGSGSMVAGPGRYEIGPRGWGALDSGWFTRAPPVHPSSHVCRVGWPTMEGVDGERATILQGCAATEQHSTLGGVAAVAHVCR